MNSTRLLFSNLLYYWRTNLAVLLGVAAATAVIGGALVVGDSVRESLKQMSLDRLGKIDHLLTGPRFFTEELANSLGDDAKNVTFAPAIVMQGTVEYGETRESAVRAGHIQVYGVDERSWDLLEHGSISAPQSGEIVLNERVASQLNLEVGKSITLIVEIPASIPRDALLGDREETVTAIDLTVSGIATEDSGLGRLGFNPTQQIPLNVFMSLDELQMQTGLAEVKRSKRDPIPKPARVNTLLIASPNDITPEQAEILTEQVHDAVTLEDLALKLVTHPDYRYVSLESEQMILENGLAEMAIEAATAENVATSPVLVYLLNELRKFDPAGDEAKKLADPDYAPPFSMYSVIAGVDLESLPSFDYRSSAVANSLQGDEVIVNTWLANDLDLGVGDTLEVKYHVVGDRGQLPEESHQFEVVAITELIAPTDDPGFTPTVPGVTDAESYDDWREPFPLKRELIPDRDDEYWEEFRTVPKVYVGIEKAQELWRSRYGELTSLRFTPGSTETLDELSNRYRSTFLKKLGPEVTGLVVQPVKSQGLQAAQGTTDFTGLFIGFSFFLILAATLLVGL
ncbi:MAG: ABC transporter permease, partial [Planctomycetaceae bacterium]|nr:ABC transporter permease [Planctomycetaceae bacterium]